MRLEIKFAEFNKLAFTDVERVRAPITKTRTNNTRQRTVSTRTSKGKFYENADSAKINVRHTGCRTSSECSLHEHD